MNLSLFAKTFKQNYGFILLSAIVVASFTLRAYNLLYNSPASDEAIYIVIGQLGIFGGDWFFYNASHWLSGSQFLFPSLSAIAYTIHGIWASRMISVISGTLLVLITYLLTKEFSLKSKERIIGSLFSASLVAGSTTALYISRLATMDSLSFVTFFISVLIIQKAINAKIRNGKRFFLAALLLVISTLLKSSLALFIPFIITYGLLITDKKSKSLFIKYYITPIVFSVILYVIFNASSLVYFTLLQFNQEKSALSNLINPIWESLKYLLPITFIGSLFAFNRPQLKTSLFLMLASIWIIGIQLLFRQSDAIDKHLLISGVFLAVLTGVGINSMLTNMSKKIKTTYATLFILYFFFFLSASYVSLSYFNTLWTNATPANTALAATLEKNDKILTETGPSTVLAIFPKVDIENISTFNYMEYGILEGDPAYKAAVNDGYFTYIELESTKLPKSDYAKKMHSLVAQSMDTNYESIYDDGKITIYRRAF